MPTEPIARAIGQRTATARGRSRQLASARERDRLLHRRLRPLIRERVPQRMEIEPIRLHRADDEHIRLVAHPQHATDARRKVILDYCSHVGRERSAHGDATVGAGSERDRER